MRSRSTTMSLWQRFASLFRQKANAALDRMEDPIEALELAYAQQKGVLAKVHESVVEVLTAEKRLELEAQRLTLAAERLRAEARLAVERGDDAAARLCLTRAESSASQYASLERQFVDVRAQRQRLESTAEALRLRVDAFRTEKHALRAQITAARASSRAGEALGGLSGDALETRSMVERAKERALELRARSEAIAELFAAETLEPGGDALSLGDASIASVEAQLQELKRTLPGSGRRALEDLS